MPARKPQPVESGDAVRADSADRLLVESPQGTFHAIGGLGLDGFMIVEDPEEDEDPLNEPAATEKRIADAPRYPGGPHIRGEIALRQTSLDWSGSSSSWGD